MLAGLAGLSPRLPLLAAWSLIGIGAATHFGAYSSFAILMVGLGMAALLLTLVWPRGTPSGGEYGGGTRLAVLPALATLVVAAFCAVHYPSAIYGSGHALIVARRLYLTAALLAPLCLVAVGRGLAGPRLILSLVAALVVAAGWEIVRASPDPAIDVWFMLQATSHGLFHGLNMYRQTWTSPPGEGTHLYPYFPASTVLVAPFYALFGDVRIGLTLALAGAAVAVSAIRPGVLATAAACLIVLSPMTTFGIEQSWTEPLVLLAVVTMVLAVERGRPGLAMVFLGAALATKQYAWLVLPAAAVWPAFGWRRTLGSVGGSVLFILPWLAAGAHAFYQGVVSGNLAGGHGTTPVDFYLRYFSLSYYSVLERRGITFSLGLVLLGTAAAVALAIWRLPRNAFGFSLTATLALGTFDFFNSHTFFNQWWLVLGLTALAVACLPEFADKDLPRTAPRHLLDGDNGVSQGIVLRAEAQSKAHVSDDQASERHR